MLAKYNIRVSDYIVNTLASQGVGHVFMVTGGAAMHLNDAFGRESKIKKVFCHHEQSCAMAAESYFRVSNRIAAVNVTAGPGATNTITGVYGAYVDSMAMIVLSGQSKRETLASSTVLPLRQLGDQEVNIVNMVKGITKYAVLIDDPSTIRYHLERALHLALQGRPGPVWLDIPIDVQGAKIEPSSLKGYDPKVDEIPYQTKHLEESVALITKRLGAAKRPVIYAGTGVRLSGQYDLFLKLATRLGVPVVGAWDSNDLLPNDHPSYAGRPGSLGDRAGNFTVQNSDFLLILGCRLNIRLVSYNWENFAPRAYKVMVDVDAAELKKPTLSIDLAIHADLRDFLPLFAAVLKDGSADHANWLGWCKERVKRYPVVLPEYWKSSNGVNPYCFMERLSEHLEDGEVIVCGDGTACVAAFQAIKIRPGQRLFTNSGCASMGYDLPAAIGAAEALPHKKRIICVAGDGSIMMNLQELQTVSGRKLPIKIFVLNNSGYHSIRQTQGNFFPDNIVGCGTDSGLSFPDFEKVAATFNMGYQRCRKHNNLDEVIKTTLSLEGAVICEVMVDLAQAFAPKLSSRKLEDGSMISATLEDMSPFLDRKELQGNMVTP
jgi:acetolactate synthase-1/2/3 large subunit